MAATNNIATLSDTALNNALEVGTIYAKRIAQQAMEPYQIRVNELKQENVKLKSTVTDRNGTIARLKREIEEIKQRSGGVERGLFDGNVSSRSKTHSPVGPDKRELHNEGPQVCGE